MEALIFLNAMHLFKVIESAVKNTPEIRMTGMIYFSPKTTRETMTAIWFRIFAIREKSRVLIKRP